MFILSAWKNQTAVLGDRGMCLLLLPTGALIVLPSAELSHIQSQKTCVPVRAAERFLELIPLPHPISLTRHLWTLFVAPYAAFFPSFRANASVVTIYAAVVIR